MIGEVKEPTWRPTSNLTTQHLEPGVKHSAGRSVLCNRNTIKERLNTMKRNLFFSLLTIVLMTSSLSAQRPGRTERVAPTTLPPRLTTPSICGTAVAR